MDVEMEWIWKGMGEEVGWARWTGSRAWFELGKRGSDVDVDVLMMGMR
jgi:hypothetical protein